MKIVEVEIIKKIRIATFEDFLREVEGAKKIKEACEFFKSKMPRFVLLEEDCYMFSAEEILEKAIEHFKRETKFACAKRSKDNGRELNIFNWDLIAQENKEHHPLSNFSLDSLWIVIL